MQVSIYLTPVGRERITALAERLHTPVGKLFEALTYDMTDNEAQLKLNLFMASPEAQKPPSIKKQIQQRVDAMSPAELAALRDQLAAKESVTNG